MDLRLQHWKQRVAQGAMLQFIRTSFACPKECQTFVCLQVHVEKMDAT